jgi:hypothetical protein
MTPAEKKQEGLNKLKEIRKANQALKKEHAVDCPQCKAKYPNRNPTRLMPGETCKVDGYVDQREPLKIIKGVVVTT